MPEPYEQLELPFDLSPPELAPTQEVKWPECSICRRRHGPEERHECE